MSTPNLTSGFLKIVFRCFTTYPTKLMNGKRPNNTNKTGKRKKPPCPSFGLEKRSRFWFTKNPRVHARFVALSTAIYQGSVIADNKMNAGIRCHVTAVFHFFANTIQISKHKPGKATATGPFASVAKPKAADAIYNCTILFSCNHVKALNKPSVIKNIK